jgi:hypothetical protein
MQNRVRPVESSQEPTSHGSTAKSEVWQRIGLVLGSLSFGFFLLEMFALINLVDYSRILGVNRDWLSLQWFADAELVHIGQPRVHLSGSARGGSALLYYRIPEADLTRFQWDLTRDGNGFRNATDLKSADIAVIGDSFVEGMTVPYEQTLTSRLTRLQGKVVANLGQPGYGPQQELIVLKRYGVPLRPRTVVWMFYEGNDLSDAEQYAGYVHRPPGWWSLFWGRSFTQSFLKRIDHLTLPPGVRASGIVRAPNSEKSTTYFFDRLSAFSAVRLNPEHLRALEETRNALAEARDICAANGCRLVVVFIPTAFRALQPACRFPRESACRNWVLNDLPERFRRTVESLSREIGYIELTPEFTAAVRGGAAPYYRDDAHWTEQGHAMAAEIVNDYLSSVR